MFDRGKIVTGLILFWAIALFPVWYTRAAGKPEKRPQPELPAGEPACIETRQYMLVSHQELLQRWREAVVRKGLTNYHSQTYGDEHEMSLSRSCLQCHRNREAFCDRCHAYTNAEINCWDCHLENKESKP